MPTTRQLFNSVLFLLKYAHTLRNWALIGRNHGRLGQIFLETGYIEYLKNVENEISPGHPNCLFHFTFWGFLRIGAYQEEGFRACCKPQINCFIKTKCLAIKFRRKSIQNINAKFWKLQAPMRKVLIFATVP